MKKSKLFIPFALLFVSALSGCVMLTSESLSSSDSKITSSSERPSSSSSFNRSNCEYENGKTLVQA